MEGKQQGRMTRKRAITTTTMLLAVTLSADPTAGANPLLSGYGGPGQGNQAILGAALLNGPSGPGGGSAGSAGNAGLASPDSGGEGTAAGAAAGATVVAGRASGAAGHGRRSTTRTTSGSGTQPYTATSNSAASQAAFAGTQTLGLSGGDLLYALLALGALVGTGALTMWLARQSRQAS